MSNAPRPSRRKVRSAEQLLISSILRARTIGTALDEGVNKSWFHQYPDEWYWIEMYYRKHQKVPSRLAFRNNFPDFNIREVDDVGHYTELARASHVKFSLAELMQEATFLLSIDNNDEAIAQLHSGIIQVTHELGIGGDDDDMIENFDGIYKAAEDRMKRVEATGMAGLPTGFHTLDERTGGLQPGHVWVVAARGGEGKTWTMLRMAAAITMAGGTVQFDALEMMRHDVAMRLHSFLAHGSGLQVFDSLALMQGKDYKISDYQRFLKELRGTVGGKFHVADQSRGRIGTSQVAAQIEKNSPDAVFIDYINLMQKNSRSDSRHEQVGDLSNELKNLATRYEIPIVVAAQLNRQHGLGKEPAGIEALAESDAIGRDADAVITMKKLSQTVSRMALPKYRHGPDGFKWWCHFNPGEGILTEVSYEKAMDLKDAEADD